MNGYCKLQYNIVEIMYKMNKFLVYAMKIYIFFSLPYRILSICLLYSFITFTPGIPGIFQILRAALYCPTLARYGPDYISLNLYLFSLNCVFVYKSGNKL